MATPRPIAALTAVTLATLVLPATAEPTAWIHVEAPARCEAANDLPARVGRALVGSPAADLRASVVIEQRDGGYQATVQTTRAAVAVGTKVITLPTCDEAVDAAVVVLALALAGPRSEREEAAGTGSGSVHTPIFDGVPPASPSSPHPPARGATGADADLARGPRTHGSRGFRISALAGGDAGTLASTTAYVAVGVARDLAPVELRGVVRYGLPRVEENETNGTSERLRSDFAVLDLDACYRLGARWKLSTCAGAELGVARSARDVRTADRTHIDTDSADPRIAGALTALFGYRGGMFQPELELSGVAVAIGRQQGAPFAALRAGLGVAVQF